MLYIKKIKNQIVEITDQVIEEFEMVDVTNLDEAFDKLNELKLSYSEDIESKLEEIFADREDVLDGFDIKVSTENRSFNELADMFQEKDIDIPDVQRKFVWDTHKCSKLIESILMGLPIPPLFFMDKGKNKYEVIDGLQRLTAISNFILGNNWGSITNNVQRNRPAKLSSNVDSSIANKKFEDLTPEQQKKIKRATVTVIDFRQIVPDNDRAKYLIFERINTGSELLNAMQIRKALAYGRLISSLYDEANKSDVLKQLFSRQHINKDRHVEFLLGAFVTYQILKKQFSSDSQYQKYILNDFCEINKDSDIDHSFVEKFNEKLAILLKLFGPHDIFKKVDSSGNYHGNRNNNIAEVLLATAILENSPIDDGVLGRYETLISQNIEKFSVNKITEELIEERYGVCKLILES
ncbi:DUF262 domain-containing protein [Streptococcus oralis]|jgi:hypothetical protein|uniref:GmrSD restriction endonucleases N-terminal domain-containing protein n=1 Tax=Streptococcus oralis subsp. dentisani TaxID=1458253 RepID=A0A1X1IYV3_STROR|nr:DUF262 domain-containing protein [Streptococcus oralis]ORO78294.1 hypothetical protein B7707_04445 [Streptococcus oralis subsp. dentisani]RKV76457.1 MAG: DUF262 domain-containing protein [Streptococcus sp.]